MKLYIGEQLKALRKEKQITQETLADVLGVSYQSVSRWELGVCYPDMELLPTIANYFGVTIDRLLSNDVASKALRPLKILLCSWTAVSRMLSVHPAKQTTTGAF